MLVDLKGKTRLKVGLHTHTTRSDGRKTPEEVLELFAAAGYDALALTDHWVYSPAGQYGQMTVISGAEYDMNGSNEPGGMVHTFHILGLFMEKDPEIPVQWRKNCSVPIYERVRQVVERIHAVGGLAVLAHPAWSLNTPEQILEVCAFDATEIYNSVSECGMSDRPDSGLIVDMLGARGVFLPLLATDDAHYYDGDEMKGMIMVEAEAARTMGLAGAIRAERFYATQGPELHLERLDTQTVQVCCSEGTKLVFLSELPWSKGRVIRGEGLTQGTYQFKEQLNEAFVRVELTDAQGRKAWSRILPY